MLVYGRGRWAAVSKKPKVIPTLNGGDNGWMDGGEKALVPPFEVVKRQKSPLGRSVSSNFVANCSFIAVDAGH